ncbi:MAG: hypothetical protein ACR2PK_08880 [Acidimicrobiales bacterium]
MNTSNGGLGRGLAAIFTRTPDPDESSLRRRFIDSALTSLNGERQLQLCGYIHDLEGDPSVTMRSPQLESLHPTEAYRLFAAISNVPSTSDGAHALDLGSSKATAVVTLSDRANGLFFFGDPSIDDAEGQRLVQFCSVYAPVILDHDRPFDDQEKVHLVLDQAAAEVHAEVTVVGRIGKGSGDDPHSAVARAAIAAISDEAELVEVGQVRTETASAFVVAVGSATGVATGAADSTSGDNIAVAVAAIRAARGLCPSN